MTVLVTIRPIQTTNAEEASRLPFETWDDAVSGAMRLRDISNVVTVRRRVADPDFKDQMAVRSVGGDDFVPVPLTKTYSHTLHQVSPLDRSARQYVTAPLVFMPLLACTPVHWVRTDDNRYYPEFCPVLDPFLLDRTASVNTARWTPTRLGSRRCTG